MIGFQGFMAVLRKADFVQKTWLQGIDYQNIFEEG